MDLLPVQIPLYFLFVRITGTNGYLCLSYSGESAITQYLDAVNQVITAIEMYHL